MFNNVLTMSKKFFIFGGLILREYSLFFFIAITFLITASLYLGMQEKDFSIELIVKNTGKLSILMLGIAFFYLLLNALILNIQLAQNPKKKKSGFAGALARLLIGSFGASTIPTGISLVLCAFSKMEYMLHLSGGIEVYIAFAGITLMSIAVLSIYEEKTRMEDEIKGPISSIHNILHAVESSSIDNTLSATESSD